jgi:hypothetical protein
MKPPTPGERNATRRVSPGYLTAWLILLTLVTALSLLPRDLLDENASALDAVSDKLQHIAAYCTLAVLAVQAVTRVQLGAGLAVLSFAHGVALEFLQAGLAIRRDFEWADILCNGTGVACGIALTAMLRRYARRRAAAAAGELVSSEVRR